MGLINVFIIIIIVLELSIFIYYLLRSKLYKNIVLLCIIVLIISVLVFYVKINIFDNIITNDNLSIFLLTLMFYIELRLLYSINQLEIKNNKIRECISEYEKIIDSQGKKNHEYNNQLLVLKGYINNKKRLEEYLNELINDHIKGQNFKIKQLSKIHNGGLKELLYYKIRIIKEKNIKYYLYISKEASESIENIDIKLYKNITKVLGVLIDNSIDGAIESIEKELSIEFNKDDEYIIITISNSYNKKMNINNNIKKGLTTKGKGHGFGLKLVKDIIKNYKELELITESDEKYFTQILLIDQKNKWKICRIFWYEKK